MRKTLEIVLRIHLRSHIPLKLWVVTWWHSRSPNTDCNAAQCNVNKRTHLLSCGVNARTTTCASNQAINSIGKRRENLHQSSIFSYLFFSIWKWVYEWMEKKANRTYVNIWTGKRKNFKLQLKSSNWIENRRQRERGSKWKRVLESKSRECSMWRRWFMPWQTERWHSRF